MITAYGADNVMITAYGWRLCTEGPWFAWSTDPPDARAGRPCLAQPSHMPPLEPTLRRDLVVVGGRATVDQDLRERRSVAVYRGVHVDTRLAGEFSTRCRAALETQSEGAMLSHRASAVAHGLRWVPAAWCGPETDVDVAVRPPRTTRQRAGIRSYERLVAADEICLAAGLPCMSPTRTLVELARERSLPALLVVQLIDGALRDERTTVDELLACADRLRGHKQIARARGLICRARPGVDSPQETRLRMTLEDGGVTGLQTDIRIEEFGRLLARGELGDPRLLLWAEYDGFDVHTQREVFESDRPRHRWVEARGWDVLRFANGDFSNPRGICRDWLRAAANAPARIAAMPASRSPEVAEARRLLGLDM